MAKKKIPQKPTQKDFTIAGIDGGGTRTRGVLIRNGKTIATTLSGTTRVGAIGVGESCERLLNVIKDLCEQTDIDSLELDAVVIGLAGVWLEEEKKRSAQLLKTLARSEGVILNDLIITSDAELAVHGAFNGGPGVVLIVGTGSIVLGKTTSGKFVRSGGWGIELDDEGSGAWIGREGITAVFRALDGRGKKTILANKIAEMISTIDLKEPRTIVKAYAERNFEYQMLTPLVMRAAEKGDEVCLEIIKRAAFHIMELLEAIGKNYKTKTVEVALMGGVIENDTLLAKMLDKEIKKHKKFRKVNPKGSATDGAIAMGKALLEEVE
ncbi:BadF/BadG/BcrA/BcrD ATPase family protein [Bacteroidota bacterium]